MPAQKQAKVVFVDDSMTMQKVAEITFADDAYQLVLLSDGAEVVNAVKQNTPDVVILDSDMPGVNGYEACKRLRQESVAAQLPVLLLTGPSSPYDERRGREAKVNSHLDKPFETQSMLDKVSALMVETASRPMAPPTADKGVPPAVARVPAASAVAARPKLGAKTQLGIPAHLQPGDPRPAGTARQGPAAAPVAPKAPPRPGPAPAVPAPRPAAPKEAPRPAPAPTPLAAAPAPQAASPKVAAVAQAAQQATDRAVAQKAGDLSPEQVDAVRAVAREVIEQVVWEVVPDLAETIIREELAKLLAD